MVTLTFAWPFAYEDFAAPASPWTATYWTPPELAFNTEGGAIALIPHVISQAIHRAGSW